MARRLLLVGGGAALVAAILLVIKLRGDDRPRGIHPDTTPTTGTDRASPRLPEREGAGSVQEGTPTVTERVVDGARVRDHRTGEQPPYQPRPKRSDDAHGTRLPAQLVHDISDKLKVAMAGCTAAIPPEARGPKPHAEGQIFVDVAGGQLTVKEAAIDLRNVSGEITAAKQCLERSWIGQSTPAGDTPETSHYAISVVFAVPPS